MVCNRNLFPSPPIALDHATAASCAPDINLVRGSLEGEVALARPMQADFVLDRL